MRLPRSAAIERGLQALAVAAAALHASPAEANGKFPAAGQIVVDPGNADRILVRTTFGILVTVDHGQSFDWICESGAGYAGNIDPGIAVTADGSILAGIASGIDIGTAGGCAWQLAGGPAAAQAIIDVSVLKTDPKVAVALSVEGGMNKVFRSGDSGVSWSLAGALPADFQAITLDMAPSDADRLYVSGIDKSGAPVAAVARSDDGGATFQIHDIASAGSRAPYLSAIDPTDADTVYVRLDGTPGTLMVSPDGAESWSTAFTLPGYMQAFALSPDGSSVLAGGPTDGLWRAPTSTYQFTRVDTGSYTCLSWPGDEVYACGPQIAVSRSLDDGDTFSAVLRLECIRGPLACDAQSPVTKLCPAEWTTLTSKIATQYCQKDAGAEGGSQDTGTTSSTGGSESTPPSAGCGGCAGAQAPNGPSAAIASLAAALAVLGRRRRAANETRSLRRGKG